MILKYFIKSTNDPLTFMWVIYDESRFSNLSERALICCLSYSISYLASSHAFPNPTINYQLKLNHILMEPKFHFSVLSPVHHHLSTDVSWLWAFSSRTEHQSPWGRTLYDCLCWPDQSPIPQHRQESSQPPRLYPNGRRLLSPCRWQQAIWVVGWLRSRCSPTLGTGTEYQGWLLLRVDWAWLIHSRPRVDRSHWRLIPLKVGKYRAHTYVLFDKLWCASSCRRNITLSVRRYYSQLHPKWRSRSVGRSWLDWPLVSWRVRRLLLFPIRIDVFWSEDYQTYWWGREAWHQAPCNQLELWPKSPNMLAWFD